MSRPLVLVVDDYADNRELFAEYLRLHGIAVATAASGEEAVASALAEPPSLILMDLAMPGMSGGDALRRLRQDARTVAIPVIALTARVLQHEREHALTTGFDAFIAKPCLPDDLLEQIRPFLEHARDFVT